jgi:hypothetical protein
MHECPANNTNNHKPNNVASRGAPINPRVIPHWLVTTQEATIRLGSKIEDLRLEGKDLKDFLSKNGRIDLREFINPVESKDLPNCAVIGTGFIS